MNNQRQTEPVMLNHSSRAPFVGAYSQNFIQPSAQGYQGYAEPPAQYEDCDMNMETGFQNELSPKKERRGRAGKKRKKKGRNPALPTGDNMVNSFPRETRARCYTSRFTLEDTQRRDKVWGNINVNNSLSYTTKCDNPDAEKALYDECDVVVACTLKGIFADALVKIQDLLQENEVAPNFTATMGTPESELKGAPGSTLQLDPPAKNNFEWFHRVPV